MARIGCGLFIAIAILILAALSSCASAYHCRILYEGATKKYLSCDVQNTDQEPSEPEMEPSQPASQQMEVFEIYN